MRKTIYLVAALAALTACEKEGLPTIEKCDCSFELPSLTVGDITTAAISWSGSCDDVPDSVEITATDADGNTSTQTQELPEGIVNRECRDVVDIGQ